MTLLYRYCVDSTISATLRPTSPLSSTRYSHRCSFLCKNFVAVEQTEQATPPPCVKIPSATTSNGGDRICTSANCPDAKSPSCHCESYASDRGDPKSDCQTTCCVAKVRSYCKSSPYASTTSNKHNPPIWRVRLKEIEITMSCSGHAAPLKCR